MTNTVNTKHTDTANKTTKNVVGTRKKLFLSMLVASTVALASGPVAAKKYRAPSNSAFDYAKVVNVEPIYETYQVHKPVEHCYTERVRVTNNRYYGKKSKTPEIIGGIIGGAIGNRVGKNGGGNARDVATVVGAVLGGSIARDIKHKNHNKRYGKSGRDHYETVERCEIEDSYTTKKELVGYDVAYKYRGNVYYSHFDQHPGDRIKIKVSVKPV